MSTIGSFFEFDLPFCWDLKVFNAYIRGFSVLFFVVVIIVVVYLLFQNTKHWLKNAFWGKGRDSKSAAD